jgi:NAD(P)-binding Rossmann-like domain
MTENFETDYFVIGAGAAAMAFADELLTNSDARILMVDRRDKPGGHWNDAYPFVRLHQPSAFYGVNSRELGSRTRDAVGFNKGLYNLASGAEVLAYFDQVMQQRLLPSGRVQYFPMCNVTADDQFESLLTGERHRVAVRKSVVDSAYWTFDIPSSRPPRYSVALGVRCVPPNAIPRVATQQDDFVVVGPGKTGIDTCLWLLERGIDPERIRWVMPHDAWFINRANIQPGDDFFLAAFQSIAQQFEAVGAADDIADLFDRLESSGQLLRLDPAIRPTIYRCATITEAELAQLRRIKQVVRLGYVRFVDSTRVVLDRGEMPLSSDTLVIDCSASGISRKPQIPIWSGNRINVQMIRTCQPTFSAALIGFIEATFADREQKNALCEPVPNPVLDTDWLRMLAVTTRNRVAWRAHPNIEEWLVKSRLNTLFAAPARVKPDETGKMAVLMRLHEASSAGMAKLPQLLANVSAAI